MGQWSWDSSLGTVVLGQSWDSAVLGRCGRGTEQSWDSAILGRCGLGALVWDSGRGTVGLGQWSWDRSLGTVVLGQ